MGWLDKEGLAHLWGKVKGYVDKQAGSGTNLSSGNGIVIDGDQINVTTPVQGIFSQADFDTLPEEQKNKGLYVIPDAGGTGNEVSEEIYSTEEVRIGTWIDGRPLYRRCFRGTSPATNVNMSIGWFNEDMYMVNVRGILFVANETHFPLPFVWQGYHISLYTAGTHVYMETNNSAYAGKPCVIVLEYTKPADEPVSSFAAPRPSQEVLGK